MGRPVVLAAAFALSLAGTAPATTPVTEVMSPGGIAAWLVEAPEIPFIALEIRFRGGGSLDPEALRGVTYMMAGLLEEGAGDLDAVAFRQAQDDIAAQFSFDASRDTVSISARFLTETTAEAVALLRTAIHAPRFDDDAVERVRDQLASVLASRSRSPGHIAGRAFDRTAFGDHPYGASHEGSPESIRAIGRDDLLAAHRAALARDRMVVSVVGDIDAERLAPLLDDLLGELPRTGAPLPPRAGIRLSGELEVIDHPGPQSLVRFGQAGLSIDHPDFFAALVLNHILGGGGFGSRLTEELRERRGLTYGIGTGLVSYEFADLLAGQFSTSNERLAEAKALVVAEWRRMRDDGVTEAEVEAARTYLTGAYPLRFSSNAAIARILAGMQLSALPSDYMSFRNELVEAVTVEDVNRVARDLLDPETLSFVIVGRPAGLAVTQ